MNINISGISKNAICSDNNISAMASGNGKHAVSIDNNRNADPDRYETWQRNKRPYAIHEVHRIDTIK